MNHAKIFKGQPLRFAVWELVPKWYKTFPPDYIDQVEIKNSTMLSNTTSTASSCAEDQILENKILETRFQMFVLNDK